MSNARTWPSVSCLSRGEKRVETTLPMVDDTQSPRPVDQIEHVYRMCTRRG